MTDYDALERQLPELDRLYRAHLVAATIENWQQHCELWRLEAHNALTAIRDLRAERDALVKDAKRYHKAMDAYRRTKMEHGLCQPRSRKACSHCAGVEKLDALLAEYKGPRIILAALAAQERKL